MSDSILYDSTEAVATITLNRPDVLNALDWPTLQELHRALAQAADDATIRCVLLTGNGRAFCAGADLAARPSTPGYDSGVTVRERYNPLITAISGMPKPVITAVNGPAVGAGMGLALAGDVILASETAYFLPAFARIGLVADAGCSYFLPRFVGHARARALILLARKISAAQALQQGIVWNVVSQDTLRGEARSLAAHMATQPTLSYALNKRLLDASGANTLTDQLELEATLQSQAGASHDCNEGIQAFLQKRTPKFIGN